MPRNNLWIYLLTGIVLFALAGGTALLMPECAEGNVVPNFCDGDKVMSKSCVGGKWQTEEVKECSESCEFGVCLDSGCSGAMTKYICRSPYSAIRQDCSNGNFENELIFCEKDEYCKSNTGCLNAPLSCGDGTCDTGENEINCYNDCGAISEWDSYFLSTPVGTISNYTECTEIFDCDNRLVMEAVNEMESQCSFSNPKEWVECASKWVYSNVDYEYSGGNAQCGESASDILKSRIGNCVDMSTLFIAMARYKRIPARHGGVCLSHSRSLTCQTYSIYETGAKKETLKVGHINGLRGDEENAQPLGHAIAEVYNPVAKGWSIVDPTFNGLGLAKECWGYSPVLEYRGVNNQVCYISDYDDQLWCRAF